MRNKGSKMSERIMVETLAELQIWIEGKFALVMQAQDSAEKDLTTVRRTVHDLAGHMQVLLALNLPEKLVKLEEADKNLEAEVKRFSAESAERKGVIAALKALWGVSGVVLGFIGALAFQFYKVAGN